MDAKRKKIYIAILAIAVIVVLVAGLRFIIRMKKEPAPLDPENAAYVSIKIPSGATTAVIGQDTGG